MPGTIMTSPQVLLKDWNLYPIKQLGQNFLKDPSTAAMIVSRAHLTDRDIVLEIGAGLGALTLALAVQVQKVFAIEKDRRLLPILQSEVFRLGSGNVSILNGDILDIDINTIAQDANQPIIVVGNLPYNISSQILARLVLSRPSVIRAVFMLQKNWSIASRRHPETGATDDFRSYCNIVQRFVKLQKSVPRCSSPNPRSTPKSLKSGSKKSTVRRIVNLFSSRWSKPPFLNVVKS